MNEEDIKDFEERKQKFLAGYKALMDEHKIDIFAAPSFVPDGTGFFKLHVESALVDLKNQGVPSKIEDFL